MRNNLWFQHDYDNIDDINDATLEEALKLLAGIKWESYLENIRANPDDYCPPGLGIDTKNDSFFHLYRNENDWGLLLQLNGSKKILGMIPKELCNNTYIVNSLKDIPQAIKLLYSEDYELLLEFCNSKYFLDV